MAKKQENNDFEEIKNEVTYWTPQEGDVIMGTLSRKYRGNYGEQCIIETEDGEVGLPSHKILEGLMSKVEIGDYVKVECVGSKPSTKTGRSPTTLYKVSVKRV